MRIVVLAGGIGGARFLLGVRALAAQVGAQVTAVVNVGDDVTLHGLRICPDLDSVMYTLGGGSDTQRGWGRAGETWTVKAELAAYGAEPEWFGLGDKDIATHLVRTRMLDAGYPLSAVTEALCHRWQPGIELLPATDERLETHVVTEGRAIHFQEWWIRYRAQVPTERFVFVGADAAKPAAGVLEALGAADLILVAPSNPVVSIAPILAVAALKEAVTSATAPVVGVSPVIGGAPVRDMADACLAVLGVPCTAAGVAGLYGARPAGGVLDGWLVGTEDAGATDDGSMPEGLVVGAAPLWMSDEAATAAMVRAAAALVGVELPEVELPGAGR